VARTGRQLEALGDELRCIAPNQRGFGRSTGGPLPTSLLELADDAVRLCAELGVDRAHVVGLSFGGAVAQALAVHHAGFVTSLVLAGTYRLDEPQAAVKQLSTVRSTASSAHTQWCVLPISSPTHAVSCAAATCLTPSDRFRCPVHKPCGHPVDASVTSDQAHISISSQGTPEDQADIPS